LTCEETTEGQTQGWQRPHGFVFEVPVEAEHEVQAAPLFAMGRFVHEAVAIDPTTGIIYETEEQTFDQVEQLAGSGLYRFIPKEYRLGKQPDFTQGRLQVLKVQNTFNYNTSFGQMVGHSLLVEWVDIDDPNPPEAEIDPSAVFRQGLAKGAAIFQRLEGCWFGDGLVFFNATSGGDAGAGQVWAYRPIGKSFGLLRLIFESPGAHLLDSPDNIAVSPRGGLVLCEDGDDQQFGRGVTRDGRVFDFAENLVNQNE
jgi:uncharacterized protein